MRSGEACCIGADRCRSLQAVSVSASNILLEYLLLHAFIGMAMQDVRSVDGK